MPKFRKKTPVINADQYAGSVQDLEIIEKKYGVFRRHNYPQDPLKPEVAQFIIPTADGDTRIQLGDWIVTDEEGKTSLYKEDVFLLSFEPYADPDTNSQHNDAPTAESVGQLGENPP